MSSEFIKPDGQDGLFSFVSLGTDLDSTSAAYTGGFAKITKVGAASAFDAMKDDAIEDGEAVGVGDIIHLAAWADVGSNPLSEGDECTPLVIDTDDSSWVTDRGRSMSRDLQDKTTQGRCESRTQSVWPRSPAERDRINQRSVCDRISHPA